ncbi:ATP-binding protein [Peribacillus sp. JNUCC 23]|uniref:ATP-binding protein n=1 Tax=Peribacillus sp. NPDC096379 TaxID=3364393 RepID=UPI003824D5BA
MTISNEANHLDEEDVGLLFNRFYTADQPRSGNGTDLGLSIAKSLMNNMNGKLSAELKGNQLFMTCEWMLKA